MSLGSPHLLDLCVLGDSAWSLQLIHPSFLSKVLVAAGNGLDWVEVDAMHWVTLVIHDVTQAVGSH